MIDPALLACVVIGLFIRLAAASGSPWFDEIWSWQIARAGDVLAAHDNNHLLNTLWLWVMRDVPSALAWRLPSVIYGTLSIWLTGKILLRLGREHAIAGSLLMAVCHPMVVYQSEARGYALMLLCVLSVIELQIRLFESVDNRRKLRLAITTAAICGVLAHLSFSIFYAILIITSICLSRDRKRTAVDHLAGVVMNGVWLIAFAGKMSVGGGPELDVIRVTTDAVLSLIGLGTGVSSPVIIGAIVVITACAIGAARRSPQLAMMLLAITIVYPIIVIAAHQDLIFVRYFLPALMCAILLIAIGLGELLQQRRFAFVGVIGLLALTASHGASDARLIREGRDKHAAAIANLLERSGSTTIASDADFQLRAMLEYDHMRSPALEPVRAVNTKDGPQWLVVMHAPSPLTIAAGGYEYDLDTSYSANTLSGVPWQVYRKRSGQIATVRIGAE